MASSLVWESIKDEPVIPPPPGRVPNLANPESRASEIIVASSVCLPLIVIFAALRFYAKLALLKKRTWDDVTCAFGVAAGLIYLSLGVVAVKGVYGKHLWEVTFKEYTADQLVLALVFEVIYGPFIWCVKLSLFLLYVQVFRPLRWLRYLAFAGAVFTGLFYFSVMIALLVLCTPTHGHSELAYLAAFDSQQCAKSRSLVIVLGAVSLLSDLYLVILPLPAVWRLQLPLRQKLAVAAMFFTGSIACIASAFALAFRVALMLSEDATWLFVPLGVVTNVEFTAGIMVCCMPTTTAVFKQLRSPIPFLVSSYQKGWRSIYNSGSTGRYELNSATNLQPTYIEQGCEGSTELTSDVQGSWARPNGQESQLTSRYETGSSVAFDNVGIRKTMDISVTR